MKKILPFLLLSWIGGCANDTGSTPNAELWVEDTTNSFILSSSGSVVTDERWYDWACTVGQAKIGFMQGVSTGSIRLEVFDGVGALVHDNTYPAPIAGIIGVPTRQGVPGTWRLHFTLENASWTGLIQISADTQDERDMIGFLGQTAVDHSFRYEVVWPAGSAEIRIESSINSGFLHVRITSPNLTVYDQWLGAGNHSITDVASALMSGSWAIQIDFAGSQWVALSISQPGSGSP